MSAIHSIIVFSNACRDIAQHIDGVKHPWIAKALDAIQLGTLGICCLTFVHGVFLLSCWVFTVVDPVILAVVFTTALCIYVAKQVWDYRQRELAEASRRRESANSLLLN